MLNKIKRIVPILIVLFLLLAVTALASTDVVEPTDSFYVADYANVLSGETEEYIISLNDQLYSSCGGQFCVVTIDFLNDLDAEEYSYKLFNQWGIGSSEENNGVLLLMVVAEDKYWMSCGSGIEDTFTAGKMNTILANYFEDDFLSGNYDDAAINTTDAVMDWFESQYDIDTYEPNVDYEIYGQEMPVSEYESSISLWSFMKLIIIAAILIIIISNLSRRPHEESRPRRSNPWPWLFFASSMKNTARRNRPHHYDPTPHNNIHHEPHHTSPPRTTIHNSRPGGVSGGHRSAPRSGGFSGGSRGGGGGGSRGGGAGRK